MSNSDPNPIPLKTNDQNPGQRPETSSLENASVSSSETTSLGGLSATIVEGDGFRTPTDSGKRIPDTATCPPAPRKPTAVSKMRVRKRKNSPVDDATWMNRSRRISVLLDLSEEVKSLFPPGLRANFKCKIKKARTI